MRECLRGGIYVWLVVFLLVVKFGASVWNLGALSDGDEYFEFVESVPQMHLFASEVNIRLSP